MFGPFGTFYTKQLFRDLVLRLLSFKKNLQFDIWNLKWHVRVKETVNICKLTLLFMKTCEMKKKKRCVKLCETCVNLVKSLWASLDLSLDYLKVLLCISETHEQRWGSETWTSCVKKRKHSSLKEVREGGGVDAPVASTVNAKHTEVLLALPLSEYSQGTAFLFVHTSPCQ